MNMMKSVLAITTLFVSAQISAMVIVHTPEFPADKKGKQVTMQQK
jgi:hypothetical protein